MEQWYCWSGSLQEEENPVRVGTRLKIVWIGRFKKVREEGNIFCHRAEGFDLYRPRRIMVEGNGLHHASDVTHRVAPLLLRTHPLLCISCLRCS